ncbi:MAG: nucleoside monophosphate kinase [bacterium]
MKNIIVIGPPGSGKDTQIEEMKKYLEFEMISGGDIARSLSSTNPSIKAIIDSGGLINDDLVINETDKMLATISGDKGIVFDGFPRTLHQAEKMYEILSHHSRNLDAVIYIQLEEDKIVERLSRRKVCSLCKKNIPVGAMKCIHCSGRPVVRDDDSLATIIKRVQTFLESTLPLVNYFTNKGILININGDQSINRVAKDISQGLLNVSK